MKSDYSFHYCLLIVVLVHIALLAAVLHPQKRPLPFEQPSIQGVIVAREPIAEPVVPPPPQPMPQPQETKVRAPKAPKAPPSERAPVVENTPSPAIVATPPEMSPESSDSEPISPPQANTSELNNPAPVYPTLSRRLRETGVVILEVLVKADGALGDVRIKTSSGYSRLDEAALKAVKLWRFVPAKRGHETLDFWYELPIEFSLKH